MNPLAAIRALMEPVLEGQRMTLLGPDYRQRRERQTLELERLREQISGARDDRARMSREEMNKLAVAVLESQANVDAPETPGVPSETVVGPMPPTIEEPTATLQGPGGTTSTITGRSRQRVLADLAAELGLKSGAQVGTAVETARQTGALPPSETEKFQQAEATKRTRIAASAASTRAGALQMPDTPETQQAVQNVADRIASGEMTVEQGRSLLGGVRGGQGPALVAALADRRVIPAQVRKDLVGVQTTRNIVDKMSEMVDAIIAAKDPNERAQATLMLEQFGQTTGTLLARGFGERGVVTDRDVSRVTGLVPGWKAANFAPEYAKRELAALYDVLDRNERGISEGYFQTQSRTGGAATPGAAPGTAKPRLIWDSATEDFR